MSRALKEQFPLRLIIGSEDMTFLLDDGFSFSNVDPGGFEAASFSVPKDLPQTLRGTYVRMDCGLKVAFEGRVSQVQRSLGNKTQITCEGPGALLVDNALSEVFVDRDLTRWQAPSYSRQIALLAANFQLASTQVAADPANNLPALVGQITDSWVSPNEPIAEAWYDAGPLNLIATVYYNLISGAAPGFGAMTDQLGLSPDDVASSIEGTGNLYNTGGVAGYFTPATPHRYGFAQRFSTITPGGQQGGSYPAYFRNLAAYGNHGLTPQGPDPGGFYPSQIAGYVIGQTPGLQAGVIPLTDASNYILAHSVYYDATGQDQILADMAKAAGWHWGGWESPSPLTGNPTPRIDFRPRPTLGQFTAHCLRRDTEQCDIREDLSQQYNRAVVTFTTVAGTDGAAVVTIDNPILDQAGIASRTVVLSGGTMTAATAAVFGAEALLLLFSQARVAGTVQIGQAIGVPSGPGPAWLLKSGIDRLRIGDLPSFDAWGAYNDVPISRVEMSGSSSGFETSIEVGSGANLVETLQARLAAATVLAGQGGV